ncbi:DUF2690 domain-containing protein [Streptomyces sp. NPDC058001]|uniref:DUF2690 domain-containing protein n=1 Tax=Streptomyces sp. NPDC058001 TaxID=3346300 RepID=UPI0036F12D1F
MKKHLIKKAAGVVGAATVMTLVPLAGTSYAATCSGTGCTNKGPVATGCDAGATTKKSTGDSYRYAELRWSATCDAGWVRVVTKDSPWGPDYATIESWNKNTWDLTKSLSVSAVSNGSDWSNMIGGAGYAYRVCYKNAWENTLSCSGYWYS